MTTSTQPAHPHLRTTLGCAVAVAAVVLSGCSSGDKAAPASSASAAPTSVAPSASAGPATNPAAGPGPDADLATTAFPVDLDRALATAGQTFPGGTVTKIEVDFDRTANTWVWKVDSQQQREQHEITIDAASARVISDQRDQESADPKAVDPRKLTPRDALGRATALVPGSVAKWALEWDDGVQRYTVDIRTAGSGTEDVAVAVDTGIATRK